MAHTRWCDAPLRCARCEIESGGRETGMYSGHLVGEREDQRAAPGDTIAAERWACPRCHLGQWVLVTFERIDGTAVRLLAVEHALPEDETLARCHFISREMEGDGFFEVTAQNVAACVARYPR